jgi:hypothetical protein
VKRLLSSARGSSAPFTWRRCLRSIDQVSTISQCAIVHDHLMCDGSRVVRSGYEDGGSWVIYEDVYDNGLVIY